MINLQTGRLQEKRLPLAPKVRKELTDARNLRASQHN
jgi:hypothetical protein